MYYAWVFRGVVMIKIDKLEYSFGEPVTMVDMLLHGLSDIVMASC